MNLNEIKKELSANEILMHLSHMEREFHLTTKNANIAFRQLDGNSIHVANQLELYPSIFIGKF